MTLQPLKTVFALLYFVTFWTKIIQKVEGGEEGTSAMMSVKPEELYLTEPCLYTVVC